MELLPETLIVFRETINEAMHHLGHTCSNAAMGRLLSAEFDLDYAVDALKRARKLLSSTPNSTNKGN